MTAMLDVDQLRTFIAIAETGSFTQGRGGREQDPVGGLDADEAARGAARASDFLARRPRLEADRGWPATARLRAPNRQAQCRDAWRHFPTPSSSGRVRLGVPDDYADRYLPEIMARFSRSYPGGRADRDLRTVRRSARAHRRQRDRSRHRHQLREQARRRKHSVASGCSG